MILPVDIIKIIYNESCISTKIQIKLTCKTLYYTLPIVINNVHKLTFYIITAYTKDPYNSVVAICTTLDHAKKCQAEFSYPSRLFSEVRLEEHDKLDKDSIITDFNSILYYETPMSCKITYNETIPLHNLYCRVSWTKVPTNVVFEHMKNRVAYHLPYYGPN